MTSVFPHTNPSEVYCMHVHFFWYAVGSGLSTTLQASISTCTITAMSFALPALSGNDWLPSSSLIYQPPNMHSKITFYAKKSENMNTSFFYQPPLRGMWIIYKMEKLQTYFFYYCISCSSSIPQTHLIVTLFG